MTEFAVAPEEVAALGASLVQVATALGDLDLLGPGAGWLPAGPVADAFAEVVTTWQRHRIRLEQSLGDLGEAAGLAGRVYLQVEDVTVESMRPGEGGIR